MAVETPLEILTVGDLKKALSEVRDDAWVCASGNGPVHSLHVEVGANEPFVMLVVNQARETSPAAATNAPKEQPACRKFY